MKEIKLPGRLEAWVQKNQRRLIGWLLATVAVELVVLWLLCWLGGGS